MKLYAVLIESERPFLKTFRDIESAYKQASDECKIQGLVPHLLETVRNDLCDQAQFMVGNFLEIAKNANWSIGITIQMLS